MMSMDRLIGNERHTFYWCERGCGWNAYIPAIFAKAQVAGETDDPDRKMVMASELPSGVGLALQHDKVCPLV